MPQQTVSTDYADGLRERVEALRQAVKAVHDWAEECPDVKLRTYLRNASHIGVELAYNTLHALAIATQEAAQSSGHSATARERR
jgi:hypothetical protein